MSTRCYRCFRPLAMCYCADMPRVDNQTDVLILQHPGERDHPFNTACMVQMALQQCRSVTAEPKEFGEQDLPIHEGAGLLFPADDARVLNDLSASELPQQLVVVDGTWRQAKTIVQDVPQLAQLPRFQLRSDAPGQYRIRRELNDTTLSTVEAVVRALRIMEPDIAGLKDLLAAFDGMVERQLSQPAGRQAWRSKKSRGSRPKFIPRKLLQVPSRLVVAYGESTSRQPEQRNGPALPVSWVAERLGTGERFACLLSPSSPLPASALDHMRLTPDAFRSAISLEEFRLRWSSFLRPKDVLIVFHERTSQLLVNVAAAKPATITLKSIFGNKHAYVGSLEELAATEDVCIESQQAVTRAEHRLSLTVALTNHLKDTARVESVDGR